MSVERRNTGNTLVLQVLADDEGDALPARLEVEAPGVEGYVIGRSGTGSDYKPDIDLAKFGAHEKGISRRHAALVRYQGAVHIVDLNSMNGTFVNGNRLPPDMPVALQPGDILTLANLDLQVL